MEAVVQERDAAREFGSVLDDFFDAIRSLDLKRITAHYAPDVVAYDAIAKLEFAGLASYEAHWKTCLEMAQDMIFEPRQPTIHVSGDLAVAHCLLRCGGTGPDGKEQVGWMRTTIAARRTSGRWLIVHEHYSMPFDPMSGKILGDLAP